MTEAEAESRRRRARAHLSDDACKPAPRSTFPPLVLSIASALLDFSPGTVFGIQTADGGFAKVYFTSATEGLALHSNLDGTYAY